MANIPLLTAAQVAGLVPAATNIVESGRGGQKIVFRATMDGEDVALKFAKYESGESADLTETVSRMRREVETMRRCSSRHIIKLGHQQLEFGEIEGQSLVYFSEEFIDGEDLVQPLKRGQRLAPNEVAELGRHIGFAIQELWSHNCIHRDIKPGNIMRRHSDGSFVLLDAGFAFDTEAESLSYCPVGTFIYFSPEQFNFAARRDLLDFRSDLFSLGVTMYQMATATHPFWTPGDSQATTYARITGDAPAPPSQIDSAIPEQLSDVILRLLGKSPHLRYRKCELFINALEGL